jgi:hypothetical protein
MKYESPRLIPLGSSDSATGDPQQCLSGTQVVGGGEECLPGTLVQGAVDCVSGGTPGTQTCSPGSTVGRAACRNGGSAWSCHTGSSATN